MEFLVAIEKYLKYSTVLKNMHASTISCKKYRLINFYNFLLKNKNKSSLMVSDIKIDDLVNYGEYLRSDTYLRRF
jgi:site-specific recombinase XerD